MYKNPRGWNEGYPWQERRCPRRGDLGGCGHRAWWVDNGRSPGLVPMTQWSGFNLGGPTHLGHPLPLASLGRSVNLLQWPAGSSGGEQQVALRPGRDEA